MKLIKTLLFILISLTISIKANSNQKLENLLMNEGKLIFIRHAYAPGTGDPTNFNIKDCTTQRILNKKGIKQSKLIKNFFIEKKIPIYKVLSSEWCRCKDTSFYAFENYETKFFLNSFYDVKFARNKSKQIKELKEYVKNWNGKKNLILVTHYVVILEVLNVSASSAELIIADKDFNVLMRKKISSN